MAPCAATVVACAALGRGGGAKAAAGGYDANNGMGNHTVTRTAHNCSSVVASLCQAPTTREEEHPLLFASATFNVNNAGVGTCIKDNGNRLSSGWCRMLPMFPALEDADATKIILFHGGTKTTRWRRREGGV